MTDADWLSIKRVTVLKQTPTEKFEIMSLAGGRGSVSILAIWTGERLFIAESDSGLIPSETFSARGNLERKLVTWIINACKTHDGQTTRVTFDDGKACVLPKES